MDFATGGHTRTDVQVSQPHLSTGFISNQEQKAEDISVFSRAEYLAEVFVKSQAANQKPQQQQYGPTTYQTHNGNHQLRNTHLPSHTVPDSGKVNVVQPGRSTAASIGGAVSATSGSRSDVGHVRRDGLRADVDFAMNRPDRQLQAVRDVPTGRTPALSCSTTVDCAQGGAHGELETLQAKVVALERENQNLQKDRVLLLSNASQELGRAGQEASHADTVLTNLMNALTRERSLRQEAQDSVQSLTKQLQSDQGNFEAERQKQAEAQAELASSQQANLKQAMVIIADLRKALERSIARSQGLEAAAERAYSDGIASVVDRVRASLTEPGPSTSGREEAPGGGPPEEAPGGGPPEEAPGGGPPEEQGRAGGRGAAGAPLQAIVREGVDDGLQQYQAHGGADAGGDVQRFLQESLLKALQRHLQEAMPYISAQAGSGGDAAGGEAVTAAEFAHMKKRFVMWLASERQRRQHAEASLSHTSEALARSETSRMAATQRWLDAVNRIELGSQTNLSDELKDQLGALGADSQHSHGSADEADLAAGGGRQGSAWQSWQVGSAEMAAAALLLLVILYQHLVM